MSLDVDNNQYRPTFSCHCLNIQLKDRGKIANEGPPRSKAPGFTWVYVGENGIRVSYPQATLRQIKPLSPSLKASGPLEEYQSVKCMLCCRTIYQVRVEQQQKKKQSNSKHIVDDLALQSVTGWVEVAVKECLTTSAIDRALKSNLYSTALSICLPPGDRTSRRVPRFANLPMPSRVLPDLPHFVEAPPFSPSHPVFGAFAKNAIHISKLLRQKAETEVTAFIQKQLDILEIEESHIYSELEALWQLYKTGLQGTSDENSTLKEAAATPDQSPTQAALRPRSTNTTSPSHRSPGPSLLSASLAQNSMHYNSSQASSPILNSDSIADDAIFGNTAAMKDQAASLRVFEFELHEAREKAAKAKSRTLPTLAEEEPRYIPQSAPTSAFRRVVSNPEGAIQQQHDSERKGKRKVTFNSELAVRTIERNTKKGGRAERKGRRQKENRSEAQMFDLEDPFDDGPSTETSSTPITLKSPANQHSASFSSIAGTSLGRASAFASLRPGSLPAFTDAIPARLRSLSPPTSLDKGKGIEDSVSVAETEEEDSSATEDDGYVEPPLDMGPSSLPMPTNPMWEDLASRNVKSFHPLGVLDENDELAQMTAMGPSSFQAKTFEQRTGEILKHAANPNKGPPSQKTVRRKIYNQIDRQRQIDTGLETLPEDWSDTDSEAELTTHPPSHDTNGANGFAIHVDDPPSPVDS